jgi:hypothetical protein
MYPLVASFVFENVALGMMPMLKVETPLPMFAMENVAREHTFAEIEMEAKRVLGSFRPRENDALKVENILNGGRLNRVLEQMGVLYAPQPIPGSEASQAALKK